MTDETMEEGAEAQPAALNRLRGRLPADLWDGLTAAERAAIGRAVAAGGWSTRPVNIRLTLPAPRRRFYLTLVAGWERRTPERRSAERRSHPLRTLGNLIFAGATVLAFIFLWLVAALLASAIVEF